LDHRVRNKGFAQHNLRGMDSMRLKLVFIASLVAAAVGSSVSIVIILGRFSSLNLRFVPDPLVALTFLFPVVAVVLAAVFVYRHTARRRKTQALLTGVLGAFFSLAIFILASITTSRPAPAQPPVPTLPRNVG
jgi:drug/metabolite transporter (DMT)-like permease